MPRVMSKTTRLTPPAPVVAAVALPRDEEWDDEADDDGGAYMPSAGGRGWDEEPDYADPRSAPQRSKGFSSYRNARPNDYDDDDEPDDPRPPRRSSGLAPRRPGGGGKGLLSR